MGRFWTAIALLCSLLLSVPLSAHETAPANEGPLADPAAFATETNNWHLLVDQSGALDLDDVLTQRQLLQRLEQRQINAPGGTQAVWLQLTLPAQTEPRWLWLTAPRIEHLDFYLLNEGEVERRIETGERRPSSNRPLATLPYLFNLPSDGQPRELFIRLQSGQPLMAHFQVMDESGFLSLESNAYLYGALLGALFLLSLYNLKRLLLTRYIGHAWLALLHLALLLSAVANIGLLSTWLPGFIYSQSLFADIMALTAGMLLLGFVLRFFQAQRNRRDGWALRIMLWLLALQILAMLVNEQLRHSVLVYASVCTAILLAALIAGYRWRQGYRPARLVLVGALMLLGGFAWFFVILAGLQPLPLDCSACTILWVSPLAGLTLSLALLERQQQIHADRQHQDTVQALSSAELRGRSDFLARISHEIRAPLNGVLGMTELLFSTPLSTKQRDYVQTIRTSGNELLTLINELLDIPRLQSGGIELEEVQFDLPALITDCLDIFRARAEQQEVELISFIQPEVPHTLCGDPTRLRQVLLNLLDNALKQTDAGEVLLGLTIREQDGQPHLRITVQDTGRPLQPSEREALLGANAGQDILANNTLGARIGLLIARQLVEVMQGRFGLEQEQESGNTLWIELPVQGAGVPVSEAEADGHATSLRGLRLLIVDDNETCRKVLLQQCASWGMEVTAAASGKEALALLRTGAHMDEFYDVVLLDQEMPGMTGLQLAMRIKEDLNLKHDLLLVMLTGITHAPSKVVARNAGIKRILTKPVAGYTLKTTLAEELGRRTPAADAVAPLAVVEEPEVPPGFRILVAEDDITSTKVMRGMLNKLNLQPDMVTNGEEALAAIKTTPYDLVLMDCEMPLLDGYTATRQLREWEATHLRPRTPVVALTAHVFSEHRDRAHEAGMDGHMAKPVELSELRDLVRYWSSAGRRDTPR